MYKSPNGLVPVTFTKSFGSYGIGVVAGFKPDFSQSLVNDGIAKFYYPSGEKPVRVEAKAEEKAPEPAKTAEKVEVKDDDPLKPILDAGDDWQNLNGNLLRKIAKEVSDLPNNNKADAIAAIQLTLDSRM